jgi:hypothetical protein
VPSRRQADWSLPVSSDSVNAYSRLAEQGATQEFGHFMLVSGCLSGQPMPMGSDVRAHRPVNAIVITGLVLLANMAITERDQIWFLVIYTLAALLILVRLHASDERLTWVRRRLGDPTGVASLYVRGGAAFTVLAILGSLVLTASASSAPLAGVWSDVDQRLIDLSQGLQRYLPRGGPGARITGVSFGPQAAITGRWVTDTSPALRIQLQAGDTTPYYWRAVAYDRFDLNGWSMTDNVTVDRAANSALLDETSERPLSLDARREITVVDPLEFHGSSVVSPMRLRNRPGHPPHPRRPGEFRSIDALGLQVVRVTALIATGDETPGALTGESAPAAGRPGLVQSSNVLDGAVWPLAIRRPRRRALLRPVRHRPAEQYLRSSAFTYTTDVTALDCGDRSISECFAHYRRGYCQYYASLMVMVLRTAGIPARLVQGFLPGERDPATGEEIVRFSNSHAWVEAYFPGYGWVPLDPTGGGLAQLAPLPSGAPVPIPLGTPRPAPSSGRRDEADPTRQPGLGAGQTTSRGVGSGPLIAIGVLLGVAISLLAFAAYRRGPRGLVTADSAYGDISRLAARFGFAPRPTETIYEYTGSLAEVLPGVRPELETVAQAKVEVSYGHRELGGDRLRSVVAAQRRLRVALLRLVFRRVRRR